MPRPDAYKYRREYGDDLAPRLWAAFRDVGGDVAGRRVLDFGCHWGYLPRWLIEREGAREADGVDLRPHWLEAEDFDPAATPGLRLFAGDLLTIPEIQDRRYDVITSVGTLFLLDAKPLEDVLAWFHDHLSVDGVALLQTRTAFSHVGGDLHSRGIRTPLAHLAFDRRTIDAYLEGQGRPPARAMLPYCAATWAMLYRCAGFEIAQAVRTSTGVTDPDAYERFADRLQWFDPKELNTGEFNVRLRPARPDLDPILLGGAA